MDQKTWREDLDPAPDEHQVPRLWWISGLIASTILCAAVTSPMFSLPVYEPLVAVVVACSGGACVRRNRLEPME